MARLRGDIVPQLEAMEVGDIISFPADRYSSVQSSASQYGFRWGRFFTTKMDREQRAVIVTRTE